VAVPKTTIETPDEVWVVDTCSIIDVRRTVPRGDQVRVYRALTDLVAAGHLVFPHEVYAELERDNTPGRTDDLPFDWAKKNVGVATRHGTDFDIVKMALAKTPSVLDHEKPAGADEADPYVLALALKLSTEGHQTTVITEERKDRAQKMSLNTACGLHRLVCVPMMAFLGSRRIYTPPE
jgi:hypothetical protein